MLLKYLVNSEFEKLAYVLDSWILFTDKIMDREIGQEYAVEAFQYGVAFARFINKLSIKGKLFDELEILLQGAIVDKQYVPGQLSYIDDIQLWEMKSGRLSLEFAIVCEYNPLLNTVKNWNWIKTLYCYW
jgi:hypothetical protein